MTVTVLVLAVLASWSVTQLATRDEITAGPRRRLRFWLRSRRHRPGPVRPTYPEGTTLRPTCHCGVWEESLERLYDHICLARAADPGWTYRLVRCPWCISFALSLAVGASAWHWGHTWAWQILAFGLGARVVAGAAVQHLGPPDDADEDVGDDLPPVT